MYLDNKNRKGKIGRVSFKPRGNSIRIRFAYPANSNREFTVATNTDEGLLKAIKVAQLINRDIEMGEFDDTLARYSPSHAKALQIVNKPPSLLDLWASYKTLNCNRVSPTTIKAKWTMFDRVLNNSQYLELNQSEQFVKEQLAHYSLSTLQNLFSNCLNPAINLAVKQSKIGTNPYVLPSIKQIQAETDCYETDEIEAILEAIRLNTYCSVKSAYKHDFYYSYARFSALTGARPEETVALTRSDYNRYIRFNKAYSNGVLLPYTKNKTIRLFPVNKQLGELLEQIPSETGLLFPGVKGGYLNHNNFRRRVWQPVVNGLIEDDVLDRYLPPYNLRHSFITRLVRAGVDIKTIAALSGNSADVILKRYLKADKGFELPEM